MAEVIRMPKMSDTMEEGVIASWMVKEGDTIKSGDILAEVETGHLADAVGAARMKAAVLVLRRR